MNNTLISHSRWISAHVIFYDLLFRPLAERMRFRGLASMSKENFMAARRRTIRGASMRTLRHGRDACIANTTIAEAKFFCLFFSYFSPGAYLRRAGEQRKYGGKEKKNSNAGLFRAWPSRQSPIVRNRPPRVERKSNETKRKKKCRPNRTFPRVLWLRRDSVRGSEERDRKPVASDRWSGPRNRVANQDSDRFGQVAGEPPLIFSIYFFFGAFLFFKKEVEYAFFSCFLHLSQARAVFCAHITNSGQGNSAGTAHWLFYGATGRTE